MSNVVSAKRFELHRSINQIKDERARRILKEGLAGLPDDDIAAIQDNTAGNSWAADWQKEHDRFAKTVAEGLFASFADPTIDIRELENLISENEEMIRNCVADKMWAMHGAYIPYGMQPAWKAIFETMGYVASQYFVIRLNELWLETPKRAGGAA